MCLCSSFIINLTAFTKYLCKKKQFSENEPTVRVDEFIKSPVVKIMLI